MEQLASNLAAGKREQDADVIIIGGGPGGYVAAHKLGLLGASVIVVEKDIVGGTCLNYGCIPTKALLHSVDLYEQAKAGNSTGIEASEVSVNLTKVNANKQKVVSTLVKGVESLLKAGKVRVIAGEAKFIESKTLLVMLSGGGQLQLKSEHIIIATGSKPAIPPIPGIDGNKVITSTEALSIESLPQSLVIIGGGVIGMEMGSIYAGFGAKVTVIEALEHILPNMDVEISREFTRYARRKMDIHTSSRVEEILDASDGKKIVRFSNQGNTTQVIADKVLVAIGRIPDTAELGLERAGIATEKSRILVDQNYETNIPGVYCIGDANAKTMLAHVASAQGKAVADRIAGKSSQIIQAIIPNCIYANPEIASVGLTEEQVIEKGVKYRIGKFNFRANGRSLILGKTEGFVKIIGSEEYNEILGVHIIGPDATELIAECAAVMKLEGCVEDLANTIHAHPTVSESIMEAAENYFLG